MMKKLRDDDAQALDLLLENGLDARREGLAGLDDHTVGRVAVAESVLRVFGEMPADEPSNDLVARTLAYVYAGTLPSGLAPEAGLNG